MSHSSPPPPADWYPDPHGGAYLRWWNGMAWAQQTKPHASATPQGGLSTGEQPTLELFPTAPTLPLSPTALTFQDPAPYRPTGPYPQTSPYQPTAPYADRQPYSPGSLQSYGSALPVGAWRSPADNRPFVRGMGDAIRVVFQRYATFEGRASRSEFWYWYLFIFLISIGSALLAWIPVLGALLAVGLFAFALAVLLPTYAVIVRRLRDAGFHWGFIFLALVPFGGIALLVMWCQPSKHP